MLLQIKPLPLVVLRSLSKDYVPHVHYGIEIKICIAGRCEVTCNFRTGNRKPVLREGQSDDLIPDGRL